MLGKWGFIWDFCGLYRIYMGFLWVIWDLYGISVGYMGFIWDFCGLYGIYMGFIWDLYGIYMGFIWDSYGIYMGFIWDLYGIYMGFIWDLYGIYMGFLWDLYGLMVLEWRFNGNIFTQIMSWKMQNTVWQNILRVLCLCSACNSPGCLLLDIDECLHSPQPIDATA